MNAMKSRRPGRQRGVVLVAVLWIAAALVLIVAGIGASAKGDVRAAGGFRDRVAATALADGAILMAARDLATAMPPPIAPVAGSYQVDGHAVTVEASPSSGWINLNSAGLDLLQALLTIRAGLADADAARLAAAIVDWRDRDAMQQDEGSEDDAYRTAGSPYLPFNGRFQAPEDVLQVLGMTFDVFDSIRDCVAVTGADGGGINPTAAPFPVLQILTGGDARLAASIVARRTEGEPLLDLSGLDGRFIDRSPATSYRLEAQVPMVDGRRLSRSVWLRFDRARRQAGAIRVLRRDPVTIRDGDV
ncbi:MAG: general secretion pathway protein GspK [Rhodocyclaceae bacterium]|nr:general secretion pathway protein GspK [Rhodocyclaceae bacterium]